jgi:hypothetical protein
VSGSLGGGPFGRARLAEPREVALVVGGEHGNALLGQLLGEQLQAPGLAGAGRARDQPVAVHRPERQANDGLRGELSLVHAAAEVDCRALHGISLRDRLGEIGHGGERLAGPV